MSDAHGKDLILCILEVLKKKSDAEHRLTQKQIKDYTEKQFNETFERGTFKRKLMKLLDSGLPVYSKGSEKTITDIYYEQDFNDGELCLLINSVLFADGLSKKQRISLIKRIEGLTNEHFHSYVSRIDMNVYENVRNSEVFLNLEVISEAIAKKKKVSFIKTDNNKKYEVSPYQFASKNGHQYLLCHYPDPKHKDPISHFRIDRLKNCEVLKEDVKQIRELEGFESGIKLSDYVRSHPNMWGGSVSLITFKCDLKLKNILKEEFGAEVKIEETEDNMLNVRLHASEESMFHWGLQYLDSVEIVSPESLRKRIKKVVGQARKKYASSRDKRGNNGK